MREKSDGGRWTLPGGWADVGYSPFEVAVKEAREETGLIVEATRLLALFDKLKHGHPPHPWHSYKAFIQCEVRGGSLRHETSETSGAEWFHQKDLSALDLSTERVTLSQLQSTFLVASNPGLPTLCD